MATPILMPKLGLTMEEGTVLKWLKGEGERVGRGEVILQIQTDKVEYDLEAPASGVLRKLWAREGQVVPCGRAMGVIGEPREEIDFARFEPADGGAPPPAPERAEAPPPAAAEGPAEVPPGREPAPPPAGRADGRIKVSPAARRVARELGVDYTRLRGTGPGGRIVQADIRAAAARGAAAPEAPPAPAAAAPPAPGAVLKRVPLAGMRKAIFRRMAQSWAQVARVTETVEVDLTNLLAVREASRGAWESDLGVRVSINDLIAFYTARAIRRYPDVNARLVGEEIHVLGDIHLGLAVAVPGGLLVPVIRDADKKGIDQIARESASLAEGARAGKLPLSALEGGTFTITNLGAYGVDFFSAIVNPPESAILSVGRAAPRPAVVEGQVAVRTTAYVSLNFDHRVIDGAPAAEFLQVLKGMLEHPKVMPA